MSWLWGRRWAKLVTMEPLERITAYFDACSTGTEGEIAAHFTPDAVIYDTNIRPTRGADTIGATWIRVRERWLGAVWTVDSFVGDDSGAAIEWSMTGTEPEAARPFVFRGSEHYRFSDTPSSRKGENLIAEIRQYWTFDPQKLDSGLVGYEYGAGDPPE